MNFSNSFYKNKFLYVAIFLYLLLILYLFAPNCIENRHKTVYYDTLTLNFSDKQYKPKLNAEELALQKTYTSLNEAIANKENVYKLNLRNQKLDTFPLAICTMHNLQVLYLDSNNIGSIPQEIGYLKNLQTFSISNNHIKRLTSKIVYLENLCYFNLKFNEIDSIPNEIGNLHQLRYLNLFFNREYQSLPQGITKLKYLKEIHLTYYNHSNAQFRAILNVLSQCDSLEYLSFKFSRLDSILPEIGNLKQVKHLVLAGVRSRNIPFEISKLQKLEKLDISASLLHEIPEPIFLLSNLQELNVSFAEYYNSIPQNIRKLTKLKYLSITKTGFAKSEIEQLMKDMPNTKIDTILVGKFFDD